MLKVRERLENDEIIIIAILFVSGNFIVAISISYLFYSFFLFY